MLGSKTWRCGPDVVPGTLQGCVLDLSSQPLPFLVPVAVGGRIGLSWTRRGSLGFFVFLGLWLLLGEHGPCLNS